MNCEHRKFTASVQVTRSFAGPKRTVPSVVEVRVRCAECGLSLPFAADHFDISADKESAWLKLEAIKDDEPSV